MAIIISFSWLLAACVPPGPHKPVFSKQFVKPSQEISFDEVKPVFMSRCSRCHPGMSSPDWQDYNQALALIKNGRLELRVLGDNPTMPQVNSPEAAAMTREERNLIRDWVVAEKAKMAPAPAPSGPLPIEELAVQCAGCHGAQGVATQDVVANLAGQKSLYLASQLKDYQTGVRNDTAMGAMNAIATGLNAEDLQRLAEHYSKMDPLSGKLAEAPAMDSSRKALLGKGKELAAQLCVSCHMDNGVLASAADMPHLAYQKEQYLINQLKAFRSKDRKSEALGGFMNVITADLTDDQISALALYFSVVDQVLPLDAK